MVDYQKAIEILAEVKKVVYGESGVYEAFDTAISAMQELQEYKEYGTPNGYKSALEAYDKCYYEKEIIDTELYKYQQIGTLEEVREAMNKRNKKKPIYNHYENVGESPYIKIACPNGCKIQLHPVTDKHLAHEHDYCPKCGQAIDWEE